MERYAILTRFGEYFEVDGEDKNDARKEAEGVIHDSGQAGDNVEHIELIKRPTIVDGFRGIRADLAEIMSK